MLPFLYPIIHSFHSFLHNCLKTVIFLNFFGKIQLGESFVPLIDTIPHINPEEQGVAKKSCFEAFSVAINWTNGPASLKNNFTELFLEELRS